MSVEIARARRELTEQWGAIDETVSDEVRDALLVLQLAVHLEQPRLDESSALTPADALPDDDIHLSALVLEGEEGDAARSRRSLAHEHDARGAHAGAVASRDELGRGDERCSAQMLAQQCERMSSEGESEGCVVRRNRLAFGRRAEQRSSLDRTRRACGCRCERQRPFRARD